MKWTWIGLSALVAVLWGVERWIGLAPAFLFLGALALGVALYFAWQSLLSVENEERMDFDEAMAFAAPTLAEEEKLAILRALKDLEYERAVGKISEEDFKAASAEYRARAKASIQLADDSLAEGRKKAEKWVKSWEKDRTRRVAEEEEELSSPSSHDTEGLADRDSVPDVPIETQVNESGERSRPSKESGK